MGEFEILEGPGVWEDAEHGRIAFDDEPLDALLNGSESPGPTPADYYHEVERRLGPFRKALREGEVAAAIRLAGVLAAEEVPLSVRACVELMGFLVTVIPIPPGKMPAHDISSLGALLDRVWTLAAERGDNELRKSVGLFLEKWYEHQGQYAASRRVILELVRIHRKEGNTGDMAGMINNYGFSHMLEGNLRKAMPFFKRAADLFLKERQLHRHANARANYLMCRIDSDDLIDLIEIERELETLARTLQHSAYWQQRKIHIIQAKLAERCGCLAAAIQYTEKAIELTRNERSVYTPLDTNYLQELQMRMTIRNQEVVCNEHTI